MDPTEPAPVAGFYLAKHIEFVEAARLNCVRQSSVVMSARGQVRPLK
jgi:hypothetical protein